MDVSRPLLRKRLNVPADVLRKPAVLLRLAPKLPKKDRIVRDLVSVPGLIDHDMLSRLQVVPLCRDALRVVGIEHANRLEVGMRKRFDTRWYASSTDCV